MSRDLKDAAGGAGVAGVAALSVSSQSFFALPTHLGCRLPSLVVLNRGLCKTGRVDLIKNKNDGKDYIAYRLMICGEKLSDMKSLLTKFSSPTEEGELLYFVESERGDAFYVEIIFQEIKAEEKLKPIGGLSAREETMDSSRGLDSFHLIWMIDAATYPAAATLLVRREEELDYSRIYYAHGYGAERIVVERSELWDPTKLHEVRCKDDLKTAELILRQLLALVPSLVNPYSLIAVGTVPAGKATEDRDLGSDPPHSCCAVQ